MESSSRNPTGHPRVVVVGSVSSSLGTLSALVRHGADVVGVMGLVPDAARSVSDYVDLAPVAGRYGVPYLGFAKINDPDPLITLRSWWPDIVFVVGLSQLVGQEFLDVPRFGCVGFHPTRLPAGRGRAPLAWLTYDAQDGAATFFLIDEGVDSGPIFVQEPYEVKESDDASDVLESMSLAVTRALDRWLPDLLAGVSSPTTQDDSQATYNGRRAPADGCISWAASAAEILRLVRASARPHPGAFTFVQDSKLIVHRAELACEQRYRGVVGRVLRVCDAKILVQTGDGLLWLTEVEVVDSSGLPTVGRMLGYYHDVEIAQLRARVGELERRLLDLERAK